MNDSTLRVALVGGSGFLGAGLRNRLVSSGHRVTVVGRGPSTRHDRWKTVNWDARTVGDWASVLEGADVLVHLAGKRVDCRPTKANIDELIASREGTVRLVGDAMRQLDDPPTTWVQLSSLAIFGDSQDAVIDETTAPPETGLRQQVEVCQRWEAAYREASLGIDRSVLIRPSIGIGGSGDPATRQLARLARFGLGGKVGSGKQWISWIGAEDFFDLLYQAVVDPAMAGLYHFTSPEPVSNTDLMAAYRAAVDRRFGLPSPRAVTTTGAWLLGSDPALALTGRRCVPTRLLDEGYRFRITDINEAVRLAVDGPLSPNHRSARLRRG